MTFGSDHIFEEAKENTTQRIITGSGFSVSVVSAGPLHACRRRNVPKSILIKHGFPEHAAKAFIVVMLGKDELF